MKSKKLLFSILIGVFAGLVFIVIFSVKKNLEKLPKTATFMQYNLKDMSYKDLDDFVKNKINDNIQKQKIKIYNKIYSLLKIHILTLKF